MTTKKKLYKFKTQTVFCEVFEVEAESYDKAIDAIERGIEGYDSFPINVDRISWWHEDRTYPHDIEVSPGLIGIPITMEEADKTPYYDLVKVEGCSTGDFRQPTEEEKIADEKQAVADGRLNEKFASYI